MRSDTAANWSLLALALAGIAEGVQMSNRIVFDAPRPILSQRLDPNVAPGRVSQHVHRILGASAFDGTYNATKLRQSRCTSINSQADKSNYWHPSLYKVIYDPTTQKSQYAALWGQTRIYYNFPSVKSGTGPGTYVEPFPDEFQMVAGNPGKKVGGRYLQEDLSVFYYCEQRFSNGTVVGTESYDMPKHGCTFLVTKVWFPSCWNGQPFDYANPFGHVQYPLLGGGLTGPNCPPGYERRIPSILVETFHFGPADFPDGPAGPWGSNGPDVPTYILANGDTTGYGLHADFANGWDTAVLSRIVKECLRTDIDLPANEGCPLLNETWQPQVASNCFLDPGTKVPAEPVGWEAPLDALPGCNLPWGPVGPKPTCPGFKDPALVPFSRYVGKEYDPEASLADIAKYGPSYVNVSTTAITSSPASTTLSTGSSAAITASNVTFAPTFTVSYPAGNTTMPVATTTDLPSATLANTTVAITYDPTSIDTSLATSLPVTTTIVQTTAPLNETLLPTLPTYGSSILTSGVSTISTSSTGLTSKSTSIPSSSTKASSTIKSSISSTTSKVTATTSTSTRASTSKASTASSASTGIMTISSSTSSTGTTGVSSSALGSSALSPPPSSVASSSTAAVPVPSSSASTLFSSTFVTGDAQAPTSPATSTKAPASSVISKASLSLGRGQRQGAVSTTSLALGRRPKGLAQATSPAYTLTLGRGSGH